MSMKSIEREIKKSRNNPNLNVDSVFHSILKLFTIAFPCLQESSTQLQSNKVKMFRQLDILMTYIFLGQGTPPPAQGQELDLTSSWISVQLDT